MHPAFIKAGSGYVTICFKKLNLKTNRQRFVAENKFAGIISQAIPFRTDV
jgi:hypothetical protein